MTKSMKKALKSSMIAARSAFPAEPALGVMFAVYGNDTGVSEFRSADKFGLKSPSGVEPLAADRLAD